MAGLLVQRRSRWLSAWPSGIVSAVVEATRPKRRVRSDILVVEELFWIVAKVVMMRYLGGESVLRRSWMIVVVLPMIETKYLQGDCSSYSGHEQHARRPKSCLTSLELCDLTHSSWLFPAHLHHTESQTGGQYAVAPARRGTSKHDPRITHSDNDDMNEK